MDKIKFDFNNMFSHSIGKRHGVTEADVASILPKAKNAHKHLASILSDKDRRVGLGLEWAMLPRQDDDTIKHIQDLGNEIAACYKNVISLGIGGSYLGLKAAQDALCPVYYNEFFASKLKRPKIYFDGNNLDPDTLSVLLNNLEPKKTFVVVISKSGETAETKAAFAVVEAWMKRSIGPSYGRQIIAITDPNSGALRKRVESEQAMDSLSFRSLSVMNGVGGRFSELNIGLLHLAIVGIDVRKVLDGARQMLEDCSAANVVKNPAYMYAILQTIMYRKKNKSIAIIMPFSERLKSTADWYVQLLAESLGKKYARKIKKSYDGESWFQDTNKIVNLGRTPIPARGTNDLHSIQQNNIEGMNNKTVTFIKIDRFKDDIIVKGTNDFLDGKPYSMLLSLAEEATEWALVMEERPSCAITIPEISPFYWGAILSFFEIATAFEGELLGVNAFDQPGVEGYKNYMYYKLGKAGIPGSICEHIKNNPLLKKPKYII